MMMIDWHMRQVESSWGEYQVRSDGVWSLISGSGDLQRSTWKKGQDLVLGFESVIGKARAHPEAS